jgi:hypothetical protein
MSVLAAILTCSLHNDDALVRAIADNAQGNVYSVINPDLDPEAAAAAPVPRALDAAVAQLNELVAQGATPLLGVMQVPPSWAAIFGREPRDLFEPCINVSIATAMLSSFDYDCASKVRPPLKGEAAVRARRTCVLRRYAAEVRMPDLETVVTLALRYQHSSRSAPTALADAPIFAPLSGGDRSWGSDCLFLAPPASAPPETR